MYVQCTDNLTYLGIIAGYKTSEVNKIQPGHTRLAFNPGQYLSVEKSPWLAPTKGPQAAGWEI